MAAALQVDQRVRQHQVVLGDIAVVAPHVVGEFRLAAAEIIGGPGPAGERDVHEVGRAAHHAAGRARPVQHHHPPPLQILPGAGNDERQAQRVTGVGTGEGHRVAMRRIALQVIQRCDGLGAAGQAGMGGDIRDPLAAQPDLGLALPQTGQILRALCVPAWHPPASAVSRTFQSGTGRRSSAGGAVIPGQWMAFSQADR